MGNFEYDSTGPILTMAFPVKDGEEIDMNTPVCIDGDGFLTAYKPRPDLTFVGQARSTVLGDVEFDGADMEAVNATVAVSGGTLRYRTVTGLASQSDLYREVFLTSDHGLTLTPESPGAPAIGYVARRYNDDKGDVEIYDWHEIQARYKDAAQPLPAGSRRVSFREDFAQPPLVAATFDFASAGVTSQGKMRDLARANKHFIVSGTNSSNGSTARTADGGLELETHSVINSQAFVIPTTVTGSGSRWAAGFQPIQQPVIVQEIVTGDDIDDIVIGVGPKLTATLTNATDNDQVFAKYDSALSPAVWRIVHSEGGTESDVIVTDVTVEANTRYLFIFVIDANRVAHVHIAKGNGRPRHVAPTDAVETEMASAATLRPFYGIQQTASAARTMNMYPVQGDAARL